MLFTKLLHPEILSALAQAGHGSRVLIADANYPVATETLPNARKVFLNLRPGLLGISDVLEVLVETLPFESAMMMEAPAEHRAVQQEFRALLPAGVAVAHKQRGEFYSEAKSPATALVIATGEERRFANLLLTIGVVSTPGRASMRGNYTALRRKTVPLSFRKSGSNSHPA